MALERAEAAVAGMETYLQQGDLPADAEVREFLENLALDTLLDEAGPANRALLRAATLFDLPVPEPVIGVLADAMGGSADRLRGLGLLDPYPDPYHPARLALAANPLAAGRIEPLGTSDKAALAAVTAGPLFTAWDGAAPQPGRDWALDWQLARLALLAEDPAIAAACADGAVAYLRSGPAASAFKLGQDAVGLLDRHSQPVPLNLLRRSADAAFTSGEGQAGETLLGRAVQQVKAGDGEGTGPLDQARVIGEQARRLITRGHPAQAGQLLRRAHQLFTAAGSEAEAAAAMGSIADIAKRRGDYDEVLRICREEQLPVYERLGDTRGTALTWGKIGGIALERGDYDEALRIYREEQLPAFERLGDTYSAAITWGNIADIAEQRGDYDEALRIRREMQLPVYERLGNTRSAALTWGSIADIAYRRGDYDEALRIRREIELPVYERLGDTRETALAWGKIADIAERRGDYDEALRIRREIELPVYERLGDTRETALAWGKIADIAERRGDYDEALRIYQTEALPRLERLGDAQMVTVAWGQIADMAYQRGDYDEAAELQRKRLEVSRPLGDLGGIAAASWGLARIDLARKDYQSAFPRLAESFQIFGRLQRLDGIAAVGWPLGQLLMAAGQADQARLVLGEARAAATKVGWGDLARQINDLLQSRP